MIADRLGATTAAPAAFLACLALVSCSDRSPADPSEVVVAVLGDAERTLQDYQAYLETNLPADPTADLPADPEEAAVKSRLFDSFVNEELLLAEAARRGIRLDESERNAYPGMFRRSAVVQKLVEAWAGDALEVSSEEIDALLRQRQAEVADDRALVLRSLLFEDPEQAGAVRRQIRRRRMTFDEAVAAYELTSGQAAPVSVRLGNLPGPVREAVASLKAGQVSAPTEALGGTYLFLVQSWRKEDPLADPEAREAARAELFHRRFEDASARLLQELRDTLDLEVRTRNLPFEYVPGDDAR